MLNLLRNHANKRRRCKFHPRRWQSGHKTLMANAITSSAVLILCGNFILGRAPCIAMTNQVSQRFACHSRQRKQPNKD